MSSSPHKTQANCALLYPVTLIWVLGRIYGIIFETNKSMHKLGFKCQMRSVEEDITTTVKKKNSCGKMFVMQATTYLLNLTEIKLLMPTIKSKYKLLKLFH